MKSEGRLYGALLVSASVLLLAAGVVSLVYTLSAFIGPFRVLRGNAPSAVAVRGDANGEDRGFVRALDGARASPGASVQELVAGAAVVVAPNVDALATEERRALQAFVEAGGGVVLGVRRASAARGFPQPARAHTLPSDTRLALASRGPGPVAAALQAGRRTTVAGAPRVGLGDGAGEVCWVPAVGDASECLSAAVVRRTLGRGRAVWLALAPDDAPEDGPERASVERLVRAAVAWAGRRPFVELRTSHAGEAALPGVRLRAEDVSRDRVLVHVTNAGATEARDVELRIHLNAPGRTAELHETKLFQPSAVAEHGASGDPLEFRIPAIPPGATRSFHLDLREVASGS